MLTWPNVSAYVAAGLGGLLMITNVGWYIAYDLKSDQYKNEVSAHKQTVFNYTNAQAEAAIKSYQDKVKIDEDNAKKAEDADKAYASLRAKYDASIVRFKAAQRPTGSIDLSGTSSITDSDKEPSQDTGLLISMNDANICADNTARLVTLHDWSLTYGR